MSIHKVGYDEIVREIAQLDGRLSEKPNVLMREKQLYTFAEIAEQAGVESAEPFAKMLSDYFLTIQYETIDNGDGTYSHTFK